MATVDLKPVPSAARNMVVRVFGRIEAVRKYDGKNYTRIVCPAPDAYSKPAFVEIRSKDRLGSRDEEISVDCLLSGYMRKAYRIIDKDTGELTTIHPCEMTLDAVE